MLPNTVFTQVVSITARRYDMKNKAKLVVHVRALAAVDSTTPEATR